MQEVCGDVAHATSYTSYIPVTSLKLQVLSRCCERIVDTFRDFDANGDGFVTASEFRRGLRLLGLPFSVPDEAMGSCKLQVIQVTQVTQVIQK